MMAAELREKNVMRGFQRELQRHEEDMKAVDILHDAAFKGNMDAMQAMLVSKDEEAIIKSKDDKDGENGSLQVDRPHPKDGRTLLHSAAQGLPSGMVEFLTMPPYHANLEAKDFRGRTPLLHACSLGQSRIATRLIALGADEHTEDDEGMGAGVVAAQAGHISMVLWLHNCAGVKVHAPTKDGRTALHMAAFAGQTHGIVLAAHFRKKIEV